MIKMKTTVMIEDLLVILKKNRDEHNKLYKEALDGYIEEAKKAIGQKLQKLLDGKVVGLSFSLNVPTDHTAEYNTVIGMLEMTTDDEITLDAQEYQMFVEDEWDWQRHFLLSNSTYSTGALCKAQTMNFM